MQLAYAGRRLLPGATRDAELNAFKDALDGQREHVLGILEGLSEQDLRRPVLPTGWNCLGLVRHLTVDVERFWFPGVIAGEPGVAGQLQAGSEAHWQAPGNMSAEEIFGDYRAAIERANAVLATRRKDPPRLTKNLPPGLWTSGRPGGYPTSGTS